MAIMRPHRPSAFDDAAPIDRRGKRLPGTVEALARRDELLRRAAAEFCCSMTHHQAAELLHQKLLRYRTSAWSSRDRAEDECPARLASRLDGLLWKILKARDAVPGAAMIATVLRAQ
jgi:hypothetical protein